MHNHTVPIQFTTAIGIFFQTQFFTARPRLWRKSKIYFVTIFYQRRRFFKSIKQGFTIKLRKVSTDLWCAFWCWYRWNFIATKFLEWYILWSHMIWIFNFCHVLKYNIYTKIIVLVTFIKFLWFEHNYTNFIKSFKQRWITIRHCF